MAYNNQGQTQTISYGSTLLWTNQAQDAAGRVTQELLGNGLETQRSFNAYTGWLQTIATGPDNGGSGVSATYQNDAYAYDAIGNLLNRKQLTALGGTQWSETFTYDSLNRLKSFQIDAASVRSYDYDELGNLKKKTNSPTSIGNYNYPAGGQALPHAMSSITGTVGGLTNPAFVYDANGNMVAGMNRAFTWTAGDMAATIDKMSGASAVERTEFVYGPDHELLKETRRTMSGGVPGSATNVVFHAGNIEKEIDYAGNKTLIRIQLPNGVGYLEEKFNGTAIGPANGAAVNTR